MIVYRLKVSLLQWLALVAAIAVGVFGGGILAVVYRWATWNGV